MGGFPGVPEPPAEPSWGVPGRTAQAPGCRGLSPTGHSQVRGGLHLAGRVAGKALEHAGVIREQPADLQAAVWQELEAGQLLQADEGSVLVPGHFGGRYTCKGQGHVSHRAVVARGGRLVSGSPLAWQGMATTFSISAVMCLSGSLTNCGGSANAAQRWASAPGSPSPTTKPPQQLPPGAETAPTHDTCGLGLPGQALPRTERKAPSATAGTLLLRSTASHS